MPVIVTAADTPYNPSIFDLTTDADMKVTCPKCGSEAAYLHRKDNDIWLKCLCGIEKLVVSQNAQGTETHHVDITEEISLPRKGTKLFICLGAAASCCPAITAAITDELVTRGYEWKRDEVASFLTVLRYKGLVSVLDNRRGFLGGSTWELTPASKRLLGR